MTAVEPPQRGERRVVVEGAGQTDYLSVAFHIPEARHDDYFALTVLNAVMSGGSGFLVGGGAITNHTSRLYQALVDKAFSVDISGSLMATVDPGLYQLTTTAWPGRALIDVETALWMKSNACRNRRSREPNSKNTTTSARALCLFQ